MKKGFLTLSAGIIAAAFAFAAYAQDAKPADAKPAAPVFTMKVKGDSYYTTAQLVNPIDDPTKGKQSTVDWGAFRARPELTVSNGQSQFTMTYEIESDFGLAENTSGGYAAAGPHDQDTRTLKIRNMYYKADIAPVPGLSIMGGVIPTQNLACWDGDMASGFSATYAIPKLATATVGWYVLNEAAKTGLANTADSDYFAASAVITAVEGISINPMFAYARYGSNTALAKGVKFVNGSGMTAGVKADVKMGAIKVYALGQYASAKTKGAAVTMGASTAVKKVAGYAFHLYPTFDAGIATVGVFGTVMSGDKPDTADKDESFWDACAVPQSGGTTKLLILEDNGMIGNTDASNPTNARVRAKNLGQIYGYQLAGVTAQAKLGLYTASFAAAYGRLSTVATGAKKDLGIEIDLFNEFKVAEGTSLKAELGYLIAGKAYDVYESATVKKGTNCYMVVLGMSTQL